MGTARNLKLTPDPVPQVVSLASIQGVPVKHDTSLDALMNSIQALGILQPPILRAPRTKGGMFEIIAGRRRLAAVSILGFDEVICLVYPESVESAFIPSAAIAENQVRSKNIGSDIVAMRLLIEQGYDDPKVVSALTGISERDVLKLFELRSLPQPVLDGIVDGTISTTTAGEVRKLRPQAMERALAVIEETGKLTSNDVRKVREVQIVDAASQVELPDIPTLIDPLDGVDRITVLPELERLTLLRESIIKVLDSKDTDKNKIATIRSLMNIDANFPVKGETIAQRARSRKTTNVAPSGEQGEIHVQIGG